MSELHQLVRTAGGAVELLPSLLAKACVTVLSVAGASISLTGELRLPLGASDEAAERAERLQTTLGEGPCLAATTTAEPVVVTAAAMAARWPLYHHELHAQTPFRAVVSIPLHSARLRCLGALDLYATHPGMLTQLPVDIIMNDVADQIGAVLFDTATGRDVLVSPGPIGWWNNSSVTHRMAVWIAVGMLTEHAAELSITDALATLRGYAYSHNTTLDHTAAQLTDGQISPHHLIRL